MSEREEMRERIDEEAARLAAEWRELARQATIVTEPQKSLIEQALDDGERKDRERRPKRNERDEVGWV